MEPRVLVCWFLSLFYSVCYGRRISGCDFGTPSYTVDVRGIEYENLTCRRCGKVSSAWR